MQSTQFNILADDEPAPFTILNPDGETPCLLVFDHAGKIYPRSTNFLGMDEIERYKHFTHDIGIEHIAEPLSNAMDAPLIRGNYSRAVVDLNRAFHEEACFPPRGNGIPIPGNQNLSYEEKVKRHASIYLPFEIALAGMIEKLQADHGTDPVFVLPVHSYTPEFMGKKRDMEAAVLYDYDSIFAQSLIKHYRARGFTVGDNEPYDAREFDYTTVDRHVLPRKTNNHCPNNQHVISCILEIRNDLISTPETGAEIAEDLVIGLKKAIDDYKDFHKTMKEHAINPSDPLPL